MQKLGAAVQVWQDTLILPTYAEGAPDPNPPFDLYSTTKFSYPYTLRDKLTDHKRNHAWRVVYLENEYLKCSVLPDIGGHLYTCVDKISGQSMFYANPSIKKAEIGYRGAWAAFGVEFNFPVSHNWVSMSPVDFAFSNHRDGSSSVTVRNIDRVYGMEWTVEMILRPGSTVLEEKVTLYNRSDVRRRFYWWNNAGVQVWDDSIVEYPMRYAASHGFKEVQPWPIDASGTDLSIIRNQTKGPVSLFVHGSREPFMGLWHPKTNSGVVHWADYASLPGKKIWTWGVGADGLDWRKALSDNDSAYAEVQAGLFRNQETYAFLEPRQSIRFSEYWMPVRNLGGITRANLAGVLNLRHQGKTLSVAFNTNQPIKGASIEVSDGARSLLKQTVALDPRQTWSHELSIFNPKAKCIFELRDNAGQLLLRQKEDEYAWAPESDIQLGPQKTYRPPVENERSSDDWEQIGKEQELNGNLIQALHTYRAGLQKFQDSFALNLAAGRLAASLLLYDEARRWLERIQTRDTPNPETAYYLGIAYEGTEDLRNARAAFETALRLPQLHAAAALRLGELSARAGDLAEARRYLKEVLRTAPDDLRAAEELIALERSSGDEDPVRSLSEEWLQRAPASNFLLAAAGKPDISHLAADPYRVLEVASEYMRLGLYQAAIDVLARNYPSVPTDQTEPATVLPQNHPLVAYYRAYCREKLGQSAAQDFAVAGQLSPQYVFPHTAESLRVLRAALRANPNDASAHYLLGTLLFAHGEVDPALVEWNAARAIRPQIPVLHASIGLALLRIKNDPEEAQAVLKEGLRVDRQNDQLYYGLDQALSLLSRPAAERNAVFAQYPDSGNMPADLVYEWALNRAEAGHFQSAEDLFHNRFFAREEGGTNVRAAWFEVRLQQTLAANATGNYENAIKNAQDLGSPVAGLSFTNDGLEPMLNSARTNYLMGEMAKRYGQRETAIRYFRRAAAQQSEADQLVWAAAAAKNLDDYDEATWTRLQSDALAKIKARGEDSSNTSSSLYVCGTLEASLGRKEEAEADFKQALLSPDRLLAWHLVRVFPWR